jgi:hypothetical protein
MRNPWKPRSGEDPPPTETAGELERVPREAGTATAMLQVHLRLTMESKAAQNLRGVLERDGKRITGFADQGRLLSSFCVDVAQLDLQNFTGTVRVCSCDAFDRL